jgi:hypothetical protein
MKGCRYEELQTDDDGCAHPVVVRRLGLGRERRIEITTAGKKHGGN